MRPDYDAMRRYLAQGDEINHALGAAYAGQETGRIDQGEIFFPLVVRLSDSRPGQPRAARATAPAFRRGHADARAQAGRQRSRTLPASTGCPTKTANGGRAVMVNVHGGDVAGFVRAARRAVAAVPLAPGYRVEFHGAFEQLDGTRRQLLVLVPLAALAMFALVWLVVGTWRRALIVCAAVPLALTGGVFALAWRGLPLTIPAAVGFIALGGVATLNALVLVARYGQLVARGMPRVAAAVTSARQRLRPVLMTAVAAAIGFLPMALAQGAGAEIQRPLATVVIGGILSATLLTLALVPALLASRQDQP